MTYPSVLTSEQWSEVLDVLDKYGLAAPAIYAKGDAEHLCGEADDSPEALTDEEWDDVRRRFDKSCEYGAVEQLSDNLRDVVGEVIAERQAEGRADR